MNRHTPNEILEGAYDHFLRDFLWDMRDQGYSFNDAVAVWQQFFGLDSQDPVVDAAYSNDNLYDWAEESNNE